ncbi:uncharacterized protein FTOL_13874 [Fusarium torulosum]|uniref:Uncharacterized protein n=1 Tax=Fusarium torulosum TaxID=33205 RepID=A0AAE8MPT8_9HYPO|nr:uncharacterized protein FTOL_13874 [Fusarium torulosum]
MYLESSIEISGPATSIR